MWEKIKTLFNHERYQMFAIIAVAQILLWNYGCQSKVTSITSPDTFITLDELNGEVDLFLAKAESRYKQLDQQDQIKNTLFQNALTYAATGTLNPVALLTTLGSVLGIGAAADNVRKRKEIKRLTNSG